ncbi:MAG: magnesium protoporphyrin IX methyltransferase [Pseudomonadota bacterium]
MSDLSPLQDERAPDLIRGLAAKRPNADGYCATRDRVETYFDRTATKTWERLTSDAPVSGIRATVRKGRDEMRALIGAQLPDDLRGARILDAGCGTGALAFELAARGADVLGVDISPQLVEIAQKRAPEALRSRLGFTAGDMLDSDHGRFDYIVAMDSMIYYSAADIARILSGLAPRLSQRMVFTVAPRTPLLMAMWRLGRLFPKSDRSPTMVPQSAAKLRAALPIGQLTDIARVTSGFYISNALEFRP